MDQQRDIELPGDLSALAWVQDELRKTLDNAHKSIRRHLRASESAHEDEAPRSATPPTALLQARNLVHQCAGALALVGLAPAARLLRGSEQALNKLATGAVHFDASAVAVLEAASFAALDFLRRRLAGRAASAISLFPQYRDVLNLAGAERVHPADLWADESQVALRAIQDASGPVHAPALNAQVRQAIEARLLKFFREGLPEPALWIADRFTQMADQSKGRASQVWRVSAAFFEVQALGLLASDLYAKRMSSRILAHLRAVERGQAESLESLLQDLLFFCARARRDGVRAPRHAAVCSRYDIEAIGDIDFERTVLGRYDPALIPVARRRVSALKETWSAVSSGELGMLPGIPEQSALVADSVVHIYPDGQRFANALQSALGVVVAQGQAPQAELAMEVATALLCLDASLDDAEPDQPELQKRIERLALRLEAAAVGEPSAPLEPWVEDLFRDVSDRHSMGSVVQELRTALADVELQLDRFSRAPDERDVLKTVPAQFGVMRGVLSVLGLDQAAHAVQHMRDNVYAVIEGRADASRATEELADSLGSLSFLIDLLGVQPQLAKSLFRYDTTTGRFSALMARASREEAPPASMEAEDEKPVDVQDFVDQQPPGGHEPTQPAELDGVAEPSVDLTIPDVDTVAPMPPVATPAPALVSVAPTPAPAPAPPPSVADDDEPDEMLGIFVEEAREVIALALDTLGELERDSHDLGAMTSVRRAFHTLKGSSRMVGLGQVGDVGWACEQLFNARLAEPQVSADAPLLAFSRHALDELKIWVDAIDSRQAPQVDGPALIAQANALRSPQPAFVPRFAVPPVPPVVPAVTMAAVMPVAAAPAEPSVKPLLPIETPAVMEDAEAEFEPVGWDSTSLQASPDLLEPDVDLELDFGGASASPRERQVDEVAGVGGWAETQPAEEACVDPVEAADPSGLSSDELQDLRSSLAEPVSLSDDGQLAAGTLDFDLPEAVEPDLVHDSEPMPAFNTEFGVDAVEIPGDSWPPALAEAPKTAPIPDAPVASSDIEFEFDLVMPDTEPELSLPDGDVAGQVAEAGPSEEPTDIGSSTVGLLDEQAVEPTAAPVEMPPAAVVEGLYRQVDAVRDTPASAEGEFVLGGDGLLEPAQQAWEPARSEPQHDVPAEVAAQGDASLPDFVIELVPELSADDVVELEQAADLPVVPEQTPVVDEFVGTTEPVAEILDDSDRYKVVGPLRIQIALFNIFLNEADEQSRRLCTALSEWQHEPHQPASEIVTALAHSLAGNSATVGYLDLSSLARRLEHALDRSAARGHGESTEIALYRDVADEIRHLLHQFAAGFLKPVSEVLLGRLTAYEEAEAVQHSRTAALDMAAEEAAEEDFDDKGTEEHQPTVSGLPSLQPLGNLRFSTLESLAPVANRVADGHERGHESRVLGAGGLAENLDAHDAIDPELFEIFVEEGQELLPALAEHVRRWESHGDDQQAAVAAMRVLHTFKGGARLAGAMRLGELAHRLETAIEQQTQRGMVSSAAVAQLHAGVDALAEEFDRLRYGGEVPPELGLPAVVLPQPTPVAESAVSPQFADEAAEQSESVPVELAVSRSNDLLETAAEGEADSEPTGAAESVATVEVLPVAAEEAYADPIASQALGVPPVTQPTTLSAVRVNWQQLAQRQPVHRVAAPVAVADQSAASGTVRVRAGLLDRMVNQAGEVGIARARMEADTTQMQVGLRELTDNLERLRRQLRDLELQAETQMASRIEAARSSKQSFDPLEMDRFTRVQELTRMLAESVNDVGTVQRALQQTLQDTEDQLAVQARVSRDLQDDLLRARMVEFDTLSDRLYRVVRQAAKESGKLVRLNFAGGGIELDRAVLDRMAPAFEHLLRNAVVHGIEPSSLREALGKPASGTVDVLLRQTGNEVEIEVRDDGAGLDLSRIAEKARRMGLLTADSRPTESELAGMIFMPGMTTADHVTELAGRGIGMEVVRSEVTSMGGRIETASTSGKGTAFRMVLPLTTAVTQVVVVESGDLTVALPSTLVAVVRRVAAQEALEAYQRGTLRQGDEDIPFFWLGSLLQSGLRGPVEGRNVPVLIIRSAAQQVAVHVTQVVGNQEVVVKNLGAQLSRLPGLAGMSLLPTGSAVLIYNPVALAAVYGAEVRSRMLATPLDWTPQTTQVPDAVVAAAPLAPLVMVVDDSLTVRRVTQRLLQREGYRVALAKDGLDALERLADETPAVMLCDIEMPRMDGFDLVHNLRSDPRLASLPVVMITSRIAEKHQEHARTLGVNHYLGKPYNEELLMSLVRQYAGEPVSA